MCINHKINRDIEKQRKQDSTSIPGHYTIVKLDSKGKNVPKLTS